MKQTINIFLGFMLIMVLGFFLVGFTGSVPAPTAGSAAANQSANLTKIVDISAAGLNATMLVIIGAMVFSALIFFMYSFKRRN